MAQNSHIEWTDSTWNPVTGCDKVSPGCKHCYAERMANRLKAMGQYRYRNNFQLTLQEDLIEAPISWKKPRVIFVNSMSDLFHENVPFKYIERVFATMIKANQHVYQVLTKRSERLKEIAKDLPWTDNIWMGVSIENEDYTYRIDHLRKTPAIVKFLSLEPLIGPLNNLKLQNINWVIVGGESGPGARPMSDEWVRDIRDTCIEQKIHFFFKQWGGVNKKKAGRKLDGRFWDEMPEHSFINI
ncbi:MAG: phage Gp37/Gp68 family protein [Candidatus Marinimicrobia bacterium]|nr:phage Gp37/Gp68 family protein [Candidatus Neomarinimicrobiota bacterium]